MNSVDKIPIIIQLGANSHPSRGFERWKLDFFKYRSSFEIEVCSSLLNEIRQFNNTCLQNDWISYFDIEIQYLKYNYELALKLINTLYISTSFTIIKAYCSLTKADIYHRKGNFLSAKASYQNSLSIFITNDDIAGVAYSYHMLGVIEWAELNLEEAVKYYFKAIDSYKKLLVDGIELNKYNNRIRDRNHVKIHIANIQRDLCDVYRKKGDLVNAFIQIDQSNQVLKALGSDYELQMNLRALAKIFREKGEINKSIALFLESQEIAHSIRVFHQEMLCMSNLANLYLLQGDFIESIKWNNRALAYSKIYDKQNTPKILFSLGFAYFRKANPLGIFYIFRSFWVALVNQTSIKFLRYIITNMKNILEAKMLYDSKNYHPSLENPLVHIGLIPDGTGRWATRNNINLQTAYNYSVKKISSFVDYCFLEHCKIVSVYGSSIQNFRRSQEKIDVFCKSQEIFLKDHIYKLIPKHKLKVIIVGNLSYINQDLKDIVKEIQQETVNNTGAKLYFLIGYNPIEEISLAVRSSREEISFVNYLHVKEPLDIVIRSGNANVLSNFLPLQAGYARIYTLDKLFPEVEISDYQEIISNYTHLERHYGE